jgi:serine/threonine protein kinase
MALSAGTRLGLYEILSPLGVGGMGEVYRARDTRLGREVAIKVLPEPFARDQERLARFQREARLLASLNHPNIGAIFGLEESDGIRFLVLELVPGQTLAERIKAAPLEIEESLKLCRQIAEALEAAHEKGIIHRDLKPSNVKVTDEGKVKVLDFGLAKAFAAEESASSLSLSPTLTLASMQSGVILGTAAYMSPEQARGKPLDKRTDIWSFGCVLYQCLTGRQAFGGETVSDTIAKILERDPDWQALPETTPLIIRLLLRRCLQKDRNLRLHDVADARLEIEEALATPATAPELAAGTASMSRHRAREYLGWIVAAILLVVTLMLGISYLTRAPQEKPHLLRSFILPPEKSNFDFVGSGPAGPPALSPDGRLLTFVAPTADGRRLLWVRPLDSLAAQSLRATENASYPFWSPDSRFIGFFTQGRLKKIEVTGGPPQSICAVSEGRGGTWNREGVIVYAPGAFGPLYQVSAAGGAPTQITKLDPSRHERTHRWPYFLPDGHNFLYLGSGSGQSEEIAIYKSALGSQEKSLVLQAGSNAAYASGYLIFLRDRALMAQPFDAKRCQLTGDPSPVAENVQYDGAFKWGVFSVSENGFLIYQSGNATGASQLIWFDRGGQQISVLTPMSYLFPQLSPDGQRVAASTSDPTGANLDVWIYHIPTSVPTRFTFDPAADIFPVWSPDGKRLVFASNRKGHFDLCQKSSDGLGNEEILLESSPSKFPSSWSSDGQFILYDQQDPKGKTQRDLWVLPLTGDRKPFAFLQSESDEWGGRFSPNGRWIAYTSNESGTDQVYIATFPGAGGKRQVSTGGGSAPRWRRDGKELFYMGADNKLMAADVKENGSVLEIGVAHPLFQTRASRFINYDVTGDGKRFLITTLREEHLVPITLVENWIEGLKR